MDLRRLPIGLCLRHDREKNLEALLHYFDEHIAPKHSKATLTLVGDGHDHKNLVDLAETLDSRARIHFPRRGGPRELSRLVSPCRPLH